jgi:ribosome biogenesis GTPase
MVPGLDLQEGLVNPKTGKGRHTTTAAWLLKPESGLELVDTPGVRVFGLWGVEAAELDHAYPEFRPFLGQCRFADCAHGAEPGCAIREAVRQGSIAARRYESFLKLRAELAAEARDASRSGGSS